MRRVRHLVCNFPLTPHGLKTEQLTIGQGIVLVDETQHLEPAIAREVEVLVLPAVLGQTPGDWPQQLMEIEGWTHAD